jgi:hypothetical protein
MIVRHRKTLLVVVAEGVLERTLVQDLRERGAQWWTIGEVHGAAVEGEREGAWEADRTIEMKVVCDPDVAEAMAEHVLTAYAPHYAVAVYLSEVGVARPERY